MNQTDRPDVVVVTGASAGAGVPSAALTVLLWKGR